jgi:hypothetical protein
MFHRKVQIVGVSLSAMSWIVALSAVTRDADLEPSMAWVALLLVCQLLTDAVHFLK